MFKYYVRNALNNSVTVIVSSNRMKALQKGRSYFGTSQVVLMNMQQCATKNISLRLISKKADMVSVVTTFEVEFDMFSASLNIKDK